MERTTKAELIAQFEQKEGISYDGHIEQLVEYVLEPKNEREHKVRLQALLLFAQLYSARARLSDCRVNVFALKNPTDKTEEILYELVSEGGEMEFILLMQESQLRIAEHKVAQIDVSMEQYVALSEEAETAHAFVHRKAFEIRRDKLTARNENRDVLAGFDSVLERKQAAIIELGVAADLYSVLRLVKQIRTAEKPDINPL